MKPSDQLTFSFMHEDALQSSMQRRMKRKHGASGRETLLQALAIPERKCYRTVNLHGNDPWWSRGYYVRNCQVCRDTDRGWIVQAKSNYSFWGQA